MEEYLKSHCEREFDTCFGACSKLGKPIGTTECCCINCKDVADIYNMVGLDIPTTVEFYEQYWNG